MSVELRLVLAVAALAAAFAAGAWWGARDRLCVTAPANNGGWKQTDTDLDIIGQSTTPAYLTQITAAVNRYGRVPERRSSLTVSGYRRVFACRSGSAVRAICHRIRSAWHHLAQAAGCSRICSRARM